MYIASNFVFSPLERTLAIPSWNLFQDGIATKQKIYKYVSNFKGPNPLLKVNKLPPQWTRVFLDMR